MAATQLPGTLIKDASVGIADLSATGTPSSSTFLRGDNLWSPPDLGHLTGLDVNIPAFLAMPSSANLYAAMKSRTGTGNLVFATSPTLITPDIGAATATSVNVSSGNAYQYNSVNMIRAVTANTSYWFGPSGNLASGASSNLGVGANIMTGGSVTGGFNVGVGNNALAAITSGSDNLAFGVYAMWKTTTGYYNCAFGSSAMGENTEGVQNVGVGREALATNTKGNNNVAIGFQSLFTYNSSAATDAKNVGIGQAAGYDITTGTFNTIIGGNTGRGITTGSKNTIIGSMVTGLSSSLANNIIIADGDGNQRINVDSTGKVGLGTGTTVSAALHVTSLTEQLRLAYDGSGYMSTTVASTGATTFDAAGSFPQFLFAKPVTLATGSTSLAPLKYVSGTNLTTATAGVTEYDGVQFYQTIDTTGGRAAVRMENYFHLTSTGSAITTIANFFGANSNIPLVASAYYEIEIFAYFLKTTAGTVTWSLINSSAPTGQNIYYAMSPITGIVAPPGTASELNGQYYNDTTATRTFTTGSLTTGVNHFAYFKIFLRNGTGTSLKIQATSNTGSITPGINSWWKCTRRSPNNIGTFAA